MLKEPTPFLVEFALYCDVADSAPGELNVNSDARLPPTSCTPEFVKTLTEFEESVTARMSTSLANELSALSRWSMRVAACGSVLCNPCSWLLSCAI